MITYDDFTKLDLRVGVIITAERVEGSNKLLQLKVNLGDSPLGEAGAERKIIAGIGKSYEPNSLIGQQIIVIANLESRTLMGLESQGMLLAADSESGPIIISPSQEVAPGAKIK